MFARRHPFLFFLLIMGAMALSGLFLVMAMVVSISGERQDPRGEKVGVVEIVGPIYNSKKIVRDIRKFRENKDVKAILLRIDSPGGGVGPSQEVYREVQKTSATKKVVVSMGGVAASGGYYIAAAADGIVANPGTITGSIGVIMGFTNFEELMRKIGLSPVVIKSGTYKDMGSPARPMTDEERRLLKDLALKIHRQFVKAIAQGRKVPLDQVEAIADGRIFSGEEAKELGLVDRLGNFEDALQWAGELGGIEGQVNTIYPRKEELSWLREILMTTLRLWSENQFQNMPAAQYHMQ